jgi:hypothetical protein
VSGTVLAPTPETEECCQCLELLLRSFQATSQSITLSPDYESEHEAQRTMFLVARFTKSVIELARVDLAYFPSAMVLGRSALESGLKTEWMMTPDDPLEREGRWMARLEEYRIYIGRMKRRLATSRKDLQWLQDQLDHVQQTYDAALTKFPAGFTPPAIPNMADLLVQQNVEADYAHYILASQFSHGGLMGTEIYRQELVGDSSPVEGTRPRMWLYPFQYCWIGLHDGWVKFLARTGGDVAAFEDPKLGQRMGAALQALHASSD